LAFYALFFLTIFSGLTSPLSPMWNTISQKISAVTGRPFRPDDRGSIGGGCISQSFVLSDRDRHFFVKTNRETGLEMFEAEALGLKQMHATQTICVPEPICWGVAGSSAYIVLEYLDIGRRSTDAASFEMGQKLAQMHRQGCCDRFGWERHNTIGSTPQMNDRSEHWAEFFATRRLESQLRLAARKGRQFEGGAELVDRVPELLEGHAPIPSLLHGDLWGGNAGVTRDGVPVIFDPATYYGDRETDIAMTELFGGFSPAFYQGYNEEWPLDEGYDRRKILYNLYHLLNHFNLFGSSYAGQIETSIRQLLA
jgi:fructosamine-3-kinase